MQKNVIYLLSFCLLFSCREHNSPTVVMKDDHENSKKFDSVISHYHEEIGKKYHIAEYGFDVECIYSKEDLTKLVQEMLALGKFKPQSIKDSHDIPQQQYLTIITLQGKSYEFRTSTKGDYVDLETVFPTLEAITKDLTPGFEYNFSNLDGGQIAFLIYARSSDLVNAVNEGYPCSLNSGKWDWKDQWQWGLYSNIELKEIPDLAGLRINYHKTLQELYNKGYKVPNLTLPRIYIDDLFKKSTIDIIIDGNPSTTSSNDITGKQIRCFWDGWGVALAYTLIKYYDGQPSLYNKKEKNTINISQAGYLKKAEAAFGNRQ
ncbi:MAG: hypothetical protein J7578_25350 [Chitinophagaceae bacterium]|nr:hypothetical protein [Chitinophagaceae bacterium]